MKKISTINEAISKKRNVFIKWTINSWRISKWFLSTKVMPVLIRTFWLVVNASFFAAIAGVVYMSNSDILTNKHNELFSVMAGTAGTVVAIFFSLVLIPLNQISSRYSPRFFKYLQNDPTFLITFAYAILCVVYDVTFLLVGGNFGFALAGVGLFIYLFIMLAMLWRHSIHMANPFYSVLTPEHKRIVSYVRKQLPKDRKVFKRRMKILGSHSGESGIDLSLSKVDDSVVSNIKNALLPMREIALKAIKNGELEQAENAISTMSSIMLNYLVARSEYYSDDDPLMYFFYTEFKLIMNNSNNELKLQLHPFLVDCWRNIGTYAAAVNIKKLPRINNSANTLTHYPVQGLVDLCMNNLAEADSTTPGDSCRAMADIGVTLMKEGYEQSGMHIVQKLEKISLLAEAANIGVFSGSANFGIMRVYASGLAYRNASERDRHDYAFDEIDKSVKKLLGTFLKKKRNTFDAMILNPFIGWLTDPLNGLNIARITEYALFSDGLNKDSLIMNMQAVDRSLDTLFRAIDDLENNEDRYFTGQAYENLYLIVINVTSYLNHRMASDHILFLSKEPYKNDELINAAEGIIKKALEYLVRRASLDKGGQMPGHNVMDIVCSLYLLLLYEKKQNHNVYIDNVYRHYHSLLVDLLDGHTKGGAVNSNTLTTKYFRLLRAILWSNKNYQRAKELNVPKYQYGGGDSLFFDSEYPESMVGRGWSITRPIFQKNGNYWDSVGETLGLDD